MPELTSIQKEVFDSLEQAYTRYNQLVQDMINLTEHEYISVYAVKHAILSVLNQSLNKVKTDVRK